MTSSSNGRTIIRKSFMKYFPASMLKYYIPDNDSTNELNNENIKEKAYLQFDDESSTPSDEHFRQFVRPSVDKPLRSCNPNVFVKRSNYLYQRGAEKPSYRLKTVNKCRSRSGITTKAVELQHLGDYPKSDMKSMKTNTISIISKQARTGMTQFKVHKIPVNRSARQYLQENCSSNSLEYNCSAGTFPKKPIKKQGETSGRVKIKEKDTKLIKQGKSPKVGEKQPEDQKHAKNKDESDKSERSTESKKQPEDQKHAKNKDENDKSERSTESKKQPEDQKHTKNENESDKSERSTESKKQPKEQKRKEDIDEDDKSDESYKGSERQSKNKKHILALLRYQIAEALVDNECKTCHKKRKRCCCCYVCNLCCHCVCPRICKTVFEEANMKISSCELNVMRRLGVCRHCDAPLCSGALHAFQSFTRSLNGEDLLKEYLHQCWEDVSYLLCLSNYDNEFSKTQARSMLGCQLPQRYARIMIRRSENENCLPKRHCMRHVCRG